MKKTTRLRLLLTAAIALLVSVLLASCGSATSPANRPLEPAATAGPAVQENVYLGKSQVVYKLDGRNGGVIWKQALTRSAPLDPRAASHFGLHVVDGVLYAFLDHDVYAFTASSGHALWHRHIVAVGSLTTEDLRIYDEIIDNGVIYLEHANGSISAWSARDGTELWHDYRIQANFFVVAHGAVYARVYSEADQHNTLYAFDGATGHPRWHFPEPEYSAGGTVIAADGVVYDAGGSLYALNEQSGQLLWRQGLPYEDQFFVSPQVSNGVLYASTAGIFPAVGGGPQPDESDYFHVYAFHARTGRQLWRSGPGYRQVEGIALTGQAIIAIRNSADQTDTLSAFDAQHGDTRWNISVADLCAAGVCDTPWIDLAGTTLYVVDGEGSQQVEAFDVNTGKRVFAHALSFTLTALFDHGGVSNGTAYVLMGTGWTSTTGTPWTGQRIVEAFSLSDGAQTWQFNPGALKGYQDGVSQLVLAV
jgi:outer membrane protein assembly factor BamB